MDAQDIAIQLSIVREPEVNVCQGSWYVARCLLLLLISLNVLLINGYDMIPQWIDKSSGAKWIVAESRLCHMFPTAVEVKGEHSSEGEDGIVKDALISYDDETEDKSRVGKVTSRHSVVGVDMCTQCAN